jgi:NTP pyrophosphatase (non-canonical NTP hydrolase)
MNDQHSPSSDKISVDSILELQALIRQFCEERDWDQFHDIKELAIGISTEAGELLDLFRFKKETECESMLKEPKHRTKIEDEISDVLFFILRLAGKYEIDLGQALQAKLKQNAAKYPVEKAKGSNRKYDEF